ncbi:MAG TPA: SRPBCC domain-containing protein, partial [Vicinamibacterales bacterium]|nr:SRPBCC domain-containing protein [Vicinamibacterales bacterium]
EGRGRGGFVRGSSTITLADRGAATDVTVEGTVEIGGLLARVGQRLLGSASRTMTDRFFECLRGQLRPS